MSGEPQQGMKQSHGGDDTDSGAAPQPMKKPSLKKFASMPDINIRDVFWRIMAEYASKQGQGVDPAPYEEMRSSLIRIALSVLENPASAYHGLSPAFTALYTLTLVLDGHWEDMFIALLDGTAPATSKGRKPLGRAMFRLLAHQQYRAQLTQYIELAIKEPSSTSIVLEYLVEIGDPALIAALRKWLLVIAQTDIEANQIYAISALSSLPMDSEIRNLFLRLLSHWDPQTRKAIAMLLGQRKDAQIIAEAKRQLAVETDEEVKSLLQRILTAKAPPG